MNKTQASSRYQKLAQQYDIFMADINKNKTLPNEKILSWLKEVNAYIFDLYPVESLLHSDIKNDIKCLELNTQEDTIQLAYTTLKAAYEEYIFDKSF